MALIFDLVDPQELNGFARAVQQEQDRNRFVLSQFLPNLNIDDIEYRVNTGQLNDEDAATVRAWDTESSIGGRQGTTRLMGELPPVSRKYRVGEEERLRLRSLQRGGAGNNAELVQAVYDDAAKAARAISARFEMFRGEALYTGKVTIAENGVVQTVDFARAAGHTTAPGTLWSNTAASTPITDEQAWITTYKAANGGQVPALAITSTAVVNNLLLNAQYRAMAPVNGVTPPFLSLPGINQIRAAYSLPPIVIYDVTVRVDGVVTAVIPTDRFIYLPPATEPLGRTLFGTTAEALELVGARQMAQDQAPGLTVVNMKTFDPVSTWTKGAAVGLPALFNPNLTFAADVQ